jgi:hypothetical protein
MGPGGETAQSGAEEVPFAMNHRLLHQAFGHGQNPSSGPACAERVEAKQSLAEEQEQN